MRGGSDLKKYLAAFICIALLFSILSVPAFAADISNVSAVIDSNKLVTISGILSTGAGQEVTVGVTDPKGNIEYLDSTVSTSFGNFKFSYTMKNTEAGIYNVTINALGIPAPVKTSFTYGVDNSLKDLSISSGNFDKAFSPGITSYSADVDNQIKSITVTPTVNDSTAGVKVNDKAVTSGSQSSDIMLKEGTNNISVVVTAYNGSTRTYTINVTRQKIIKTTITTSASIDTSKQVTVSGVVSSGAGQQVSAIVKAPDGSIEYLGAVISASGGKYQFQYSMSNSLMGRYNVTVSALGVSIPAAAYFEYGMDANLKNLSISSTSLSPVFQSGITSYTASVANSITSVTVIPTASDSSAAIRINGTSITNGSTSSPISLYTGANTIYVVVTAMDGVTNKTYTITVNRDKPQPITASIKAEIDTKKQVTISGRVGSEFGRHVSVLITDPNGSIEYLNTTVSAAGGTFQFSYTMSNTVKGRYNVAVGAPGLASVAATYFIYDPDDADLKDLSINYTSLSPKFSSGTTTYTSYVGYSTVSVTVTPTAKYSDAVIKVNGTAVTSGNVSGSINLNTGDNKITVVVTTKGGTKTKTYTINVVRDEPPPNNNQNNQGN